MEGERFLKQKFNLQKSPEVQSAERRSRVLKNEKVEQTAEAQIENYLVRFQEIIDRQDEEERERGLNSLKKILHDTHVINFLPDEHIELTRRIAREQGRGADFPEEIDDEMREQMLGNIRKDQIESLDAWIDELAQTGDEFPAWAKYWAIRSMLKMGTYDKEKGRFNKRTAKTTAPFPELNQAALARSIDYVKAHLGGEDLPNPSKPGENEFAEERQKLSNEDYTKILNTEDFSKYYAMVLQYEKSNEALFHITDGEWHMFQQGSSGEDLSDAIQGHGTGWCTAGMDTAHTQLEHGDFYIYFSKNELGESVIPRLAIRMEGDQIAEVRGVAKQQEVDPYITPVLEEKLQEFGADGAQYKKRVDDMSALRAIEQTQSESGELSSEQLLFLWEIEGKISGFGYTQDPRIQELREQRNQVEDFKQIYNEFIDEDSSSRYVLKLFDDKHRQFVKDNFSTFHHLDSEVMRRVVRQFEPAFLYKHYDQFSDLQAVKVAESVVQSEEPQQIFNLMEKFPPSERLDAIRVFYTSPAGDRWGSGVERFVELVPPADHKEYFYLLLENRRHISDAAETFARFEGLGSAEIEALIKAGRIAEVLKDRETFPIGSYDQEPALEAVETQSAGRMLFPVIGERMSEAQRFDLLVESFPNLDQSKVLKVLLPFAPHETNSLKLFVDKIGSRPVFDLLSNDNNTEQIAFNYDILKEHISPTEILEMLTESGKYLQIALQRQIFDELDEQWLVEKIRKNYGDHAAVENSTHFTTLSPFDVAAENVSKYGDFISLNAVDFTPDEQVRLIDAALMRCKDLGKYEENELLDAIAYSKFDKHLFIEKYFANGNDLEILADHFYSFPEDEKWLRERLENKGIQIPDEPEEEGGHDDFYDYNDFDY